jgi:myo-inositol-1(or 4)-monophosphatase
LPGADLAADLELLTEAARQAAEVALGFFGARPRQWVKAGESPVCEADIAVDRLLRERLTAARPGYGWLSEETADTPERRGKRRLFVVDPVDGTRAFLAGSPEWMVALAVVEDGVPIVAALAEPVPGRLYAAARGGGAWRSATRLGVSAVPLPAAARVAGGKAQLDVPLPAFAETVPRIPSLALRLVRVATGEIDAAFASSGSHDWDLAAADLLVREAGGLVTDTHGRPLAYNGERTTQPHVMAANAGLHAAVLAAAGRAKAPDRRMRPG